MKTSERASLLIKRNTHTEIIPFPLFAVDMSVFVCVQSCPTRCNPMDCRLPGSSVHGTSQAKILEWVAISYSRGSSRPKDRSCVSCSASGFFTNWATREASCCFPEKLWIYISSSNIWDCLTVHLSWENNSEVGQGFIDIHDAYCNIYIKQKSINNLNVEQ